MHAIEYGILCQPSDEKALVKNVNSLLAVVGYRKMYKWIPSGLRNPGQPDSEPRYSHYYCQFMKQHPRWYFDLCQNINLDGKARFPDQLDAGWTLYTSKTDPERNSEADNASLDQFFFALAGGVGFPTVLLHTYQQGENRL